MMADRLLVPLTGDELRALLRRREELLVAGERAAVEAAIEEADEATRALSTGALQATHPSSGRKKGSDDV